MILKGRGLSKGIGESELIVSRDSVSFLGGVDAKTGRIIDEESDVFGESVAGKVFAFPSGKGSTVGSYVIYGLALNGCAPVAILNERSEVVVAVGVIISDIPLVDCVDLSLLRTGDKVKVDGNDGTVDVDGVEEVHVVTSFIENKGRILLLKRSEFVGTYQGLWAGVSGYLEENEKAHDRAVLEIEEEVGLKKPELLLAGDPVLARKEKKVWVVHPFLFHVDSTEVELDWEHTEYRWIHPSQISEFETVSRLSRTLGKVIHGMPSSDKKT
jgi:predicted aconitase with swiveling domain/ADP-ribose pyrophosphatase YjhB (NUDIX family)